MTTDIWHYPRTDLAQSVLGMFDGGLSSALTFFAPRRMGKTEFLLKDIKPLAEAAGWRVFYFSFLDAGDNAQGEFASALERFAQDQKLMGKLRRALPRRVKVSAKTGAVSGEIEVGAVTGSGSEPVKALLTKLVSQKARVLFLFDEVQVLAAASNNDRFVATLRTGLDIHKDNLKVIFTGSSREGLRRMFSHAQAPFFHFGQNLDFPTLERGFTDHLADAYYQVTRRRLNKDDLWQAFGQLQKVPQHARSLVERLALQPQASMQDMLAQLTIDMAMQRDYLSVWQAAKPLEQQLLLALVQNQAQADARLYASSSRHRLAQALGRSEVPNSAIQGAIRRLSQRGLLAKAAERGRYVIDDPGFEAWLRQHGNA